LTTPNVFDQNTDELKPIVTPVNNDPHADKLKEIVNEQGQPKYKDTASALEALKASQAHIQRLETEALARKAEEEKLREEATKAAALEAVLDRLTKNNQQPPTKVETPTNAGLDEDAIVKKLESIVSSREAIAKANSNISSVTNALVAKFGDEEKAKEAVANKAKELGMSVKDLGEQSSKTPKGVLAWFGITDTPALAPQPTTPSSSPVNPPKHEGGVKPPERSLISGPGATDAARKAKMEEIKADVYKRYGVVEV
jgi:hypothetical protein